MNNSKEKKQLTLICLFLARSEIDFRHIFPERVLGKSFTAVANLKAAIGPTNFLIMCISSLEIVESGLVVPKNNLISTIIINSKYSYLFS